MSEPIAMPDLIDRAMKDLVEEQRRLAEMQSSMMDRLEAIASAQQAAAPALAFTYTLDEVAQFLKKSPRTVHRWLMSDPDHWLHACKVPGGGSYRFKAAQVKRRLGQEVA